MKGAKFFTLDNNRQLFLKEVLAEYEMIPLFFICQDDNKNLYSVIRKYIDEDEYIVVKNKDFEILKMLNNEITMCSLFLRQEYFWEIVFESQSSEHTVTKKRISEIDTEDLPAEDEFFGAKTTESIRLENELNFNSSTNDSPVYDIIYDVIRNQYNSKEMGENIRKYVEMIYNQNLLQEYELSKLGYVQKNPIITEMSNHSNNNSEKTVCVNEFIIFAA